MIQVKKLSKEFGPIKAVDDVSFSVEKGEVLGFLGPNGAGKSTTIRMIAGYITPSDGEILIDGKNLVEAPIESKSKIGYMPETNPLYKEMTAREFLEFSADIRGIENIDERVDETIKTANLEDVADQLIETLSKGYRSRLSFAAAILHKPPILLLDEPTDGLDPNQKNEIRHLIKSLSKDTAVIVSTHILEEVEAMCSRVVIISEGKVVLDGTPEDLRSHCDTDSQFVVSFKKDQKDQAKSTLSQANIPFEELYQYQAPLDEAFRKLTKSVE
jgi:ABC-2 type transport system ATP-binding protein